MNQEAVALAADSAVSGPKIFTSANKIFALSKYHPVGVMVNDSAQFLDVPWETIIKAYRAELGQRSFATLREQAAHFLGFFDQPNPLFPPAAQERCNKAMFEHFFRVTLERIDLHLEERMADGEELRPNDLTETASTVVRDIYDIWTSADDLISIPSDHNEALSITYGQIIEHCIDLCFEDFPLSDDTRRHLSEIAISLVTKNLVNAHSPFHSGVVIAGFGRTEHFPSLYEFDLETIALNKLKYFQADTSRVGDDHGQAVIRSFAQDEQVTTFMEGIDSTVKQAVIQFLAHRLPSLIETTSKHFVGDQAMPDTLIANLTEATMQEFVAGLERMCDEMYVQPIIRVVAMMPKDELAAMAESLVKPDVFQAQGDRGGRDGWRPDRCRGNIQGRRTCMGQA